MASMKSLAKDTAIYGLSSIVGRFLNYLLVPLYTHVLAVQSGGYGIVTNLYAYVALILVILTQEDKGVNSIEVQICGDERQKPEKRGCGRGCKSG